MSTPYDCSCWCKYPNTNFKRADGTWKCVDKYECVRDLQKRTCGQGKTHCKKKEVKNND